MRERHWRIHPRHLASRLLVTSCHDTSLQCCDTDSADVRSGSTAALRDNGRIGTTGPAACAAESASSTTRSRGDVRDFAEDHKGPNGPLTATPRSGRTPQARFGPGRGGPKRSVEPAEERTSYRPRVQPATATVADRRSSRRRCRGALIPTAGSPEGVRCKGSTTVQPRRSRISTYAVKPCDSCARPQRTNARDNGTRASG